MAFEIPFGSLIFSDVMAASFGALVTTLVIRSRAGAKHHAEQERRRLCELLEGSPDAILQIDADGSCTYASTVSGRLLERVPADLVGQRFAGLADEETDLIQGALTRARAGKGGSEAIFRRMRSTGEQQWLEARIGPADSAGCMTVVLRDVSTRKTAELALRVANAELNKLAGSDGLTGLLNRRRFDQMLESECRRASRNQAPATLLLLDVDRFKAYNDRHGHQAGDACLKQIAGALRLVANRPNDVAARFSGEQLALLLPGLGEEEGLAVAERIRRAVSELCVGTKGSGDQPEAPTVSIGCATLWPTPDDLAGSAPALVTAADQALYEAKRLGRNRVTASAGRRPDSMVRMLAAEEGRLFRIDTLQASGALMPSPVLHNISRMAAVLLGMPVAFVAVLDRTEVMILGSHGFDDEPLRLPYDFCMPLLGARSALVVPRAAADPRFREVAAAYGWASLAAAPLLSGDGLHHVGALWVADRQAREPLEEPKRMLLSRLASLVMEDLDARDSRPSLSLGAA